MRDEGPCGCLVVGESWPKAMLHAPVTHLTCRCRMAGSDARDDERRAALQTLRSELAHLAVSLAGRSPSRLLASSPPPAPTPTRLQPLLACKIAALDNACRVLWACRCREAKGGGQAIDRESGVEDCERRAARSCAGQAARDSPRERTGARSAGVASPHIRDRIARRRQASYA